MKKRLKNLLKQYKNIDLLLKKKDQDGDPYFLWISDGIIRIFGLFVIALIGINGLKNFTIFFLAIFLIILSIIISLMIYGIRKKLW